MEKDKELQEFEEYFKEDLEAIEEELKKSKEYSAIIDKEIDKLSSPDTFATKGSQHYLIEHITNAVELQTQRQGLRKDRVAIKKLIMDYANKLKDKNSVNDSTMDIMTELKKLLDKPSETKTESKPQNDSDLDSEIDNILDNTEEDE